MGALEKIPGWYQVSEAEYLANFANDMTYRYEYANGFAYAMTGTSQKHNLVAGNIFATLKFHLKGNPSNAFMESIKTKAGNSYYYPDVVVDCAKSHPTLDESDYFANYPTLIIEVLSPSTRKLDITDKLQDYQRIASLEEYAVIEQDFMHVTIYRKQDNWKATSYLKDDRVIFESVKLEMSMSDIYDGIDF